MAPAPGRPRRGDAVAPVTGRFRSVGGYERGAVGATVGAPFGATFGATFGVVRVVGVPALERTNICSSSSHARSAASRRA